MKKINEQQYQILMTSKSNRRTGVRNPVIKAIIELNTGEILFVSKEDWKIKTPLSVHLGNYKMRYNLKTKTNKLDDGWVVKKL